MTKGRSIRLFLADGTPGGIITAEIMNWTGHVMVAPRARLPDLIQRPEAGRTGLYILTGIVPEGVKPPVYIGETDQISRRLTEHSAPDKMEFWDDRVCVITSKDYNLTKAHTRYLEKQLINIAQRANRCEIKNVQSGTANGVLPEADISDMEFFIEQVRTILPVLGFDFLRDTQAIPIHYTTNQNTPNSDIYQKFTLTSNKYEFTATAADIDGDFVVLEGSWAKGGDSANLYSYRNLRDTLRQDGTLKEIDGYLQFTRNTPFKSPSAASSVILDRNDNGRKTWKMENTDKTYADWQADRLAAVTPDAVGEGA
jgi:hypothetical protein